MSQNEIIDQMMVLVDVLHDMGITPNITTSLCDNVEFKEFRAVVKAINLYVDMCYDDSYADRGDS